jgi:squalene-hopene/tetraprenyl-beta-curcumene cyclase
LPINTPKSNTQKSQSLDSISSSPPTSHDVAWLTARDFLHEELGPSGQWSGELSTSALSTATAISALAQVLKAECVESAQRGPIEQAIASGRQWLSQHQNADGGFGDTDRSHSNIATTLLVLAAWELAGQLHAASPNLATACPSTLANQKQAAWDYVQQQGSWDGLRRRYGKDKTFVVPILSNCALAGLVSWNDVPSLPFELAWLPQDLYRWARMPVVSYAIPALVAIGQARFHFAPPRNPVFRVVRRQAAEPTLRVLRSMQPASGGYLEATPLTSFVLMSLAAVGNGQRPVAQACLKFILDSRLADGSWPIDTNLATWLTSLTIHASARRDRLRLSITDRPTSKEQLVTPKTVRWLLSCQHRKRHPFTGANPGGWGWTDLSGAVPDADDTPAALLALSVIDWSDPLLMRLKHQAFDAVGMGIFWLRRLQNRDGGWPTFCRGWGQLPFDRSGTDLTAHTLRAFHAWLPHWDEVVHISGVRKLRRHHIEASMARGLRYLAHTQQIDGSWLPLWFGNQDRPDEDNPVYGTGRVLLAYAALGLQHSPPAVRGLEFLREQQNADGGWGGGTSVRYPDGPSRSPTEQQSTIEETAVALEALVLCGGHSPPNASIMRARDWLASMMTRGNIRHSWPIGFYFAKLWYHERLYPAIFGLGALGAASKCAKVHALAETAAEQRG